MPDDAVRAEVAYEGEALWLTQNRIAELFAVSVPSTSPHPGTREVDFYVLGAIITVGYRVNSRQATQFRLWGTRVLPGFGMYLDYEEDRAGRQISMRMADRVARLDAFPKFNECDVLTNAGGLSHELGSSL
jgi:hypothetical protein